MLEFHGRNLKAVLLQILTGAVVRSR